ncbi:hypothetical protein GQ85_24365 [Rhodococcus rhodochrous]|nr:hypothetical protein GQ85_24365 [Rhodococcus rhodochrous]
MDTYLPIFEQTRAAVPTPLVFSEPFPVRPVAETDPAVAELVAQAPAFMRADAPLPRWLWAAIAAFPFSLGFAVYALAVAQ